MPTRQSVPYDLIAIGDSTIDVFLKLHDATVQCSLDRRSCLLCLRYADKIPVEDVRWVPAAGNAANNAVGSARLGLHAALVTILGDDEDGISLARELRRNRVAMDYVTTDRRHRTNFSVVLNFRSERTILVHHAERTYRLPRLAPSRFVYLTSMGEGWERVVRPLLRYAKSAGALLAFNPGTYQLRSGLTVLAPLLAAVEVLLVNREEAVHLLGSRPSAQPRTLMKRLAALGPKILVITDGPAGSYALHNRDSWFIPPFPLPAVERTGAGDAFSTGFLAALSYGAGVAEALRWGTANAGAVIQEVGPQAGLLTLPETRAMLRKYPKLVARPLS